MLRASSKSIFKKQVQQTAQAALNLLFPIRCVGCNQVGSIACSTCLSKIECLGENVCTRCSSPLRVRGVCTRCQGDSPPFHSISSAFRYSGVARELIHAFKYERQTALAPLLAELLTTHRKIPREPFILCAVPLHPKRERERGFNQSQLLATELSGKWNCEVLNTNALVRVKETESQVSHGDVRARQLNMEGAFRAESSIVQGKSVIIIDDVCTSGATIRSCASALLDSGAELVTGLTFARAGEIN